MDEEMEGHRKPLGRQRMQDSWLCLLPGLCPTLVAVCEWSQCRSKQRGWTDRVLKHCVSPGSKAARSSRDSLGS